MGRLMIQKVPLPDQRRACKLVPGKPTILFGAGIFAAPAIYSLGLRGVTPTCICDNSTSKHGGSVRGIPVKSPLEVLSAPADIQVVITAAPAYVDEIRAQLDGMGVTNVCDCAQALSEFSYCMDSFDTGVSKLHRDLDHYFYEYFRKRYPEKLIVPSLDVVITEKCSLRCRDCANLMQYYSAPKDIEFGELFSSLDVFMQSVDHVLELRVLGGETFMNKRAHEYIEGLRRYNNYTRIAVYSNGIIVPQGRNLQCLVSKETYLRISDYGPLSKNIRAMTDVFDAHGIAYDVERIENWQDCAGIFKRERSQQELESTFACCCANNTLTLLNNRIYVCPFAANAANLGALPDVSSETVDLTLLGHDSIRTATLSMLREKRSFSSCQYCAGRPLDKSPLPAAVQASVPLAFRRSEEGGA
jgi:hypothetical protein